MATFLGKNPDLPFLHIFPRQNRISIHFSYVYLPLWFLQDREMEKNQQSLK